VTHEKGALRSSGVTGGIGNALKWLIVDVLDRLLFIAARISLLGRSIGERFKTRVGARPWLRTTETWLSVDERGSVSGVGRGFSAGTDK
jgi:hypothetical protein